MDSTSRKVTKRPYESPTVSRVYVDPIIDMLSVCGDPTIVGDGKTSLGPCQTLSS